MRGRPFLRGVIVLLLFTPNPMAGPCTYSLLVWPPAAWIDRQYNIVLNLLPTYYPRIFIPYSKFLIISEFEGKIVFFFEYRGAQVVNALQLSLILTEIPFIDQYPTMSRSRTLAMAADSETISRFFISRLDVSAATILATTLELATRDPDL
ncbi:hypothetical protein F5888DRAFT_1159425 [Russula emetica]|nr:hypothetical protein F5888DRAFT_1159425 [Russula emetica]